MKIHVANLAVVAKRYDVRRHRLSSVVPFELGLTAYQNASDELLDLAGTKLICFRIPSIIMKCDMHILGHRSLV